MEQALYYMESRYSDDLTREHMAALAHVNPEHFSRTFRKRTGRTFNAHLTLLRLRSAQRRLLTGAPDLTTLAQEVGYKDSFYLSRKFKQAVGISPTAYQRNMRTRRRGYTEITSGAASRCTKPWDASLRPASRRSLWTSSGPTSNVRTTGDFRADPIWGNLPAVKYNQLYIWPEERSWYYDPLAVLAQTEELAGWLANQAAH
ncbi:hypothetical protein J27TS7_52430 [Paenibacillus dendritiformis]|uniref:AraC family transcriptional regulator n=1 Tax=Paenibacillus dendritiformis TaxID=130049 RepID=UPI001B0DC7DD|nr:AraC family transcriptional regulator [Paenibacillus dendritiformis]GIO75729.1 hypothetical protein J27TS7_52430 [Paenibacillus dendritiformis]